MACVEEIEKKIKGDISGYKRDYLLETISAVATRQRKNDNGEYLPAQIQKSYLKKLIPQGDKYLDGLVNTNIIRRSGQYTPGERSFEYSIEPNFKSPYARLPLTNAKLIRRLQVVYNNKKTKNSKSVRGRSEQVKYLRKLTMTEDVFDAIERHYSYKQTDSYNYALASATKIQNRSFSFSVDKTSQRFHSNITNMPKILIPYLRINGKSLNEADVNNCQPYLTAGLLKHPQRFAEFTLDEDLFMMLNSLVVPDNQDVKTYTSLTTKGEIYEFLRDHAWQRGIPLSNDPEDARSQVKKELFRIMFGLSYVPAEKSGNRIQREMTLLFKEKFPTVWNLFSQIKGDYHIYNRFAILLQRVESHIILDIVAKEIENQKLGPFLTKHDSVFLVDNVEAVEEILTNSFQNFTGFSPKISINRHKEV